MLARRDHARAELARKLAPHAAPEDDLDGLLDELERTGALSDARLAEQLMRRYQARHGPLKLQATLRRRGVREATAEAAVDAARRGEFAAAADLLRRKFPQRPEDRDDWARRARYLQNRGFSIEVIRRVLDAPPDVAQD
jgi:regulatory protein